MGRLYAALFGLTLVVSASMAFAVLAVYELTWWPGVVAAALLALVALVGGGTIPRALRPLAGGLRRTARAAVVMASSLWGLELFAMALITWGLGKRVLSPAVGAGSPYLTLGLFIFLAFAGAGIGGLLATIAYFVHVRNEELVVPARLEAQHRAAAHGAPAGH